MQRPEPPIYSDCHLAGKLINKCKVHRNHQTFVLAGATRVFELPELQTREFISARKTSYGHNNKDRSPLTGWKKQVPSFLIRLRQLTWHASKYKVHKFHQSYILNPIVQELCESRGGRPELSVLTSLLVSVDVKNY